MFKDDQMISILTGAVLMVVIGTMVHRAEGLSFLAPDEPVLPEVYDDAATARANALVRVDVLANDTGLDDAARDSLHIVEAPACGRVFVQDGALQYLSEARCTGVQRMRYGVTAGDLALSGEVAVTVGTARRSQPLRPRPAPELSAAPAKARAEMPAAPKPDTAPEQRAQAPAAAAPADTGAPALTGIVPQQIAEPGTGDRGIAAAPGVLSWPSHRRDGHQRVDFSIAVVERAEPDTLPPAPPVHGVRSVAPDFSMPRTEGTAPGIGLTLVRPEARGGLKDVDRIAPELLRVKPAERAIVLPPVETQPSPSLPAPVVERDGQPDVATPEAPGAPAPVPAPPTEPRVPRDGDLQSLAAEVAPCTVAPDMTLDVRRGAITVVSLRAPCHAETVARLSYGGVAFAIPLDGAGQGALTTLGLAVNMPALLQFSNGDKIDFDLPFRGIDRVSRIAITWDGPVDIGLHALEFGAARGSAGHVHAGNPRSFSSARRARGGFLNRYRPRGGVGDNVQVYTFWHKRSGTAGVVELMVDYAAQPDTVVAAVCGGAVVQPEITVRRSERGLTHRTIMRKLPRLDCSTITRENRDNDLISGAVDDLVVVPR